ncbi:MAG: hypothetical protein LBU72_07040 [Burkholderiaceae bacterium]|jgi:uncharacterized protein YqfB (UPF0267 family)|nr:hypothetical protein [Burkholderiaceae bacterium]
MCSIRCIIVFLFVWFATTSIIYLHAEPETTTNKTVNTTDKLPLPPPTTPTPSEAEKQAYCRNVQDLAEAEKRLDTGIDLYGRVGKSDSNPGLQQIVIGVQKSLSKHLQGNAALRVAKLTCDLYGSSLDLELITKYKMAAINQQVARQQTVELENILHLIDDEIAITRKRKNAGDATMADITGLRQQRQQIYGQYITAKGGAIIPSIPNLPKVDAEKTMHQVDDLTRALQVEINRKQALQAWDIALIAGWEKPTKNQTGNFSADIPPYGLQSHSYTINGQSQNFVALTFSYNINMEPYKHKLADSVESLMAYRHQQNDGLDTQVKDMQKNISDTLKLQRDSLIQIDQQIDQLNVDLNHLQGLESIEALKLGSQIRINLAIASMQDHLARLTIKLLSTNDYAQN